MIDGIAYGLTGKGLYEWWDWAWNYIRSPFD